MFRNTLILLGFLFFAFCLNAQQTQTVYTYGQMTNTNGASIDITFVVDAGGIVTTGMATTEPDGGFITQISWDGSSWSSITASFMNCDSTLTSVVLNNNPNEVDNPVDIPFELNYCEALNISGCTDPAASNYNPDANTDDGSCIYEECEGVEYLLTVSTESLGNNLDYELIFNNEYVSSSTSSNSATLSLPFCLEDGCGTLILEPGDQNTGGTYFNFTTGFDSFDSGQIYPGEQVFVNFGNQEDCQMQNIHFGCMDNEALNFNPWATVDNGNCEYEGTEEVENDLCENAAPLLEGTQLISNVGANSNEGIFGDCWAFGNGKGEQSSVWYTFTTPEEPAAITIEAITDGTNTFTDTQFGLFEECGGEMIFCDGNSGNGLMSKFEFECGELEPNTTYILLVDGYQGDNGTCYLEYTVDGSCEGSDECEANPAVVNIVTNTWSEEISWAILQEGEIVAEGSDYEENNYQYTEEICLEDGCYTFEMYDSYGDGWNGGEFSIWLENGTFITSGELETGEYGSVTFGVNADCEEEIEGCIDPEASNYNPEATIDDGSCEYSDCEANEILVQLNAGPGALFEWSFENTEEYLEGGGYDGQGAIEEYTFCVEDGCYNFTIYDFSDSDWTGLVCIYINGEVYLIEEISNDTNLSFDIPVNSNCSDEIEGCTDPEALNYNPEATVDDGSCEYEEVPCEANNVQVIIETEAWGGEVSWAIYGDEQQTIAEGAGYQSYSTYTIDLCLEDGCYQFGMYDSYGDGWNGGTFTILLEGDVIDSGTLEDGDADWEGSFDSIDFSINSDDCFFQGCTDPEAENYNPDATIDDGSCIYPSECSISFDLTADSLNLNTLFVIPSDSIGDAVGVLWDFGDGSTSTDLFPDHEYEGDGPYNLCLTVYFEVGENDTCDVTFCMEITADMIPDLIPGAGGNSTGFFINIIEDASTIGIDEEQHLESIEVYPNPATDFVMLSSNVHWKSETTVTVYNVHGATLKSQKVNLEQNGGEYKVDISQYSSGLYFINVSTKGQYKTFKILKN
ncbi:T9SS type A sorting domain-containing protein [Halocola ammonii]